MPCGSRCPSFHKSVPRESGQQRRDASFFLKLLRVDANVFAAHLSCNHFLIPLRETVAQITLRECMKIIMFVKFSRNTMAKMIAKTSFKM